MKKLFSFFISCLVSFYTIGNSPLVVQDGNNPTLYVDFDECVSWFNGYNEDYSEFTALSLPVENCSSLEMAGPGYVYRNNSKENIHSCTPGIDSTSLGMCITALDNCNYIAGDSTSLIFEVKVIPGVNGMGSLEEISFYEKAPEMFNFYQGQSGTNNYPTKFGIRVLVDEAEVYQEGDINTEREWNLRTFNFSDVEAFTVTEETVFQFEILPYCLVGNGSLVQAWDIDNLTITAGCNNVNAGFVKVLGNVNICQDDTLDHTLTFEAEGAFGPNLTWIILDQKGEIVLLPNGNVVDFDTLDNGIYAIYHLAYGDDIDGLSLGNTLEDIEGCFDLSSRIVIVNNKLEAGDIQSSDGELSLQICSEDAAPNIVELIINNEVGIQTNYFLLSATMEILEVSLNPIFDLVNYDAGNYSIVAVTHNGQLLNSIPGNSISQIQGCFAISNTVTIQKEFISGGTVTLDTNLFCLNDSIADILTANVDNATGNFQQIIITNADSTIISVPTLPLDLDGVAPGECLVWNVSSFDTLTIEIDSKIDEISGGCYDLSNAVAFSRQDNNAGNLNIGGSTIFEICIADSLPDIAIVSIEESSGSNYTFVITDSLNVVISSTDMNSIDFSNAPAGVCRVWGVAHDGSFSIEERDTFSNSLAIGCTSISSDFVQVNRYDDGPVCGIFPCEVDAGSIDLFRNNFCVGDGEPDIVTGDIQGADGEFMQIYITGSDSIIIGILDSLSFDIDGLGQGTCFVWNVVSTDSINLTIGDNINNISNSCFDLSQGAPVARIQNNGGELSLPGGLTSIEVCVGDSLSDILNVITTGTGQSYEYIITDTSNVIIAIQDSSIVDLTNAPVGVCRIWGLAHNSVYNQMVGDTVEVSSSIGRCFDLSENFIEVSRFDSGVACGEIPCEVEGGFIDLFGSTYCVNDGVSDFVTGEVQGAFGAIQQIIVTDSDSIIIALPDSLSFDVDNSAAGNCIIWNIASNDSISLIVGMNINAIQNECFDLSAGAPFTRVANNARTVSLTNGMTLDTICAGDNIQNALAFTTMNTVSDSFQYVITNDANTILALPINNSFNFDVLPFGTCRVYGVAYSGAFLPEVGDSLMFDPAPNGCFDISDNFVTIVKENCSTSVDAGSISLIGGATEYCPGDSTGMTTMSGYEFHNFSLNLTGGICEEDLDNDIYPDYIMSTDKFIWVEYDPTADNVTLTEIHDAGEFIALFECTDIDLDGDVDIIYSPSSSPNKVNLLINDGSMNFVLTTIDADVQMISSINATDLDNDGDVDIVIAARDFNTVDEVRFYENDGTLNFMYTVIDTVDLLWDTEVADFDGNGEMDIVVSSLGSDLFIYMNPITTNEILTIDDAASGETRCKILDYDDDGDLDVTAISSGNLYLYTNNSGSYDKTLLVQFVSGVLYDIDDFDNDGDNDIVADGGFFLNNGDDTFTQEPIGTGMLHNIFSDVNGDGNLDIIYAGQWIENISGGYLFDVIVNGSPLGTLRWVLTDDQGNIVTVLDQDPPLTFDLSPMGAYDLYQIAYNGVITGLTVGENIGNLSGDFDLSNIIILNSAPCVDECLVDGGFIDLFGSQYCVGDGEPDFVTGEVINAAGEVQQIIVTDIDSVIISLPDTLNFDVDSAPEGSCIVWNLASNDTIALTTGIHINTIQNSCFDLSQGASFTRIFNNGGEVSISGGGNSIDICVGDGTADEITFATTGNGASYQYIVTDTFNVILALPDSTLVNFDGSPAGECRVWGLATNSVFNGSIGDTLVEPEIAGRCFDLSSNFVTVQRFETGGPCGTTLNAGEISLTDGSFEYCPGDTTGVLTVESLTSHTFNLGLTGGIGVVDLDGDKYNDYILSSDKFLWAEYDPSLGEVVLSDLATVSNGIGFFETIDIDNDGDFDIVYRTGSSTDHQLNILLNDGSQNFIEVTIDSSLSAAAVSTLIPEDFDGDGDIDILTTARIPGNNDELRLYENDGSLNFTMNVIDIFDPIFDIAIADIDANGEKDIVVSRSSNNTSRIYYNPLSTNVIEVLDPSVMGNARLLILDYDNDGDLDITSTDNGGLHLFTNDGSQNFSESILVTFLTGILYDVQDFDNDGDMDIIGDGGLYINNGDDTFTQASVGVGMQHNIFSDVNGDGVLDGFFAGGWIENTLAGYSFSIGINGASVGISRWVLTDEQGVIVSIDDQDPPLTYDLMPLGSYNLYNVVYDDTTIGGLTVGENISSLTGDFDLSNFITLNSSPCTSVAPPLTIVLNRVGESSQIFDIKNISNDTIDVTDYWICRTGNIYNRIGVTIVECGSFNNLMAPGEVKGLNLSISNTDGELAIYNAADFDNPDAMIHYVEWGSTGHGRSDEAVAANLWSTGDFVEAITPQQSIYFAGAGYSSESWNEGSTNICGDFIVDASIVFSRVSDSGQIIDLENISEDTIDVNDYVISQANNSYRVGDLVVECGNGSRILNPGDKVGLVVFPMSNVAGELALYTTSGNATFGIVSDYVQWGDAGFPNESKAVFSGVWTTGAFVPSFTSGQSIYYDGEGDDVSDWTEGSTTICGSLEANKKRIEVRISPNPAIDMVSIKIMDTQRPVTEMQVVDGNGKVIISAKMEMNNNDIYQMGINDLAPGIYFLRMKSSNAVITERFMVVK
jgi:hypothetical protein